MEWEVTRAVLGPLREAADGRDERGRLPGMAALRSDVEPDARVYLLVAAPDPQLILATFTTADRKHLLQLHNLNL